MGITRAKYAKFDNIIRRVNSWNECDPGTPKRWGLCFMFNMEVLEGHRRAGSLTWVGLRNTYFWIDPKSGIGGEIFVQMLPFADPKVLALYDRVERTANAAIRT
tara:strand:- start:509 stop:820 length:312 start_codon:yes stop_codon:yes gene_type:complete